MKKGFELPVGTTLIFILAILFVALSFVFATNAYGSIVYGQCWQKTSTGLSELKSAIQSQDLVTKGSVLKTVSLGNCIGGVVAFNKGFSDRSVDPAFASFISELEKQYCPDTKGSDGKPIYKAYMIMIPWKTLNADADVSTWQQLKNKFSEVSKLEMFQKPDCFGLDIGISTNTFYMPGDFKNGITNLNRKAVSFCYKITRNAGEDVFTITDGVGCPEEKK